MSRLTFYAKWIITISTQTYLVWHSKFYYTKVSLSFLFSNVKNRTKINTFFNVFSSLHSFQFWPWTWPDFKDMITLLATKKQNILYLGLTFWINKTGHTQVLRCQKNLHRRTLRNFKELQGAPRNLDELTYDKKFKEILNKVLLKKSMCVSSYLYETDPWKGQFDGMIKIRNCTFCPFEFNLLIKQNHILNITQISIQSSNKKIMFF